MSNSELIAVLESDASRKDKADACRQLARTGTKEAIPVLAALLPDEELSHMARYALEPIPDPAVDEALRDALGKLKGGPLVGVVGSIGMRRDAAATERLSKMLRHTDADVARTAAGSLGKIATADAAAALRQALPDVPDARRPAVAEACLACADALLAAGKRSEAAAVYRTVNGADLPKHFGVAAKYGILQAQKPASTP